MTELTGLRGQSGERQGRLPAAERRAQLLEVALGLFASGGFHGTSMEDIADAAGVTKPVLYQHFDSKQQLYLELMETVSGELLEAVTSSAAAQASPHQQVLAGFRAYFRFVRERTAAFQLLFGSGARTADEFAAEAIEKMEDHVAAMVAGFIEADVDPEHRGLLAYAIVGLAEVTGRRWVARAGSAPLDPEAGESLAARLADLVWAGLRGLPGASRGDGSAVGPPAS